MKQKLMKKMTKTPAIPAFNLPSVIYLSIAILLSFITIVGYSYGKWNYEYNYVGFYRFTKITIFSISTFLAYKNFCLPPAEKSIWAWIFLVVAIIFNPFLPVVKIRGQVIGIIHIVVIGLLFYLSYRARVSKSNIY